MIIEGKDSHYPGLDPNELKAILEDHWFNLQGNPYPESTESTLTSGSTDFISYLKNAICRTTTI